MDECINLMNKFSTKTLRELNKKGYSVVNPKGNNVTSINDIVFGESASNYQIPDKHLLCNARVWNKGHGGRCSKIKNADSDVCYQHTNIKAKYGELLFGKYNEAYPSKYPYYYKKSGKTIQWKRKKAIVGKPLSVGKPPASKMPAFVRKSLDKKKKKKIQVLVRKTLKKKKENKIQAAKKIQAFVRKSLKRKKNKKKTVVKSKSVTPTAIAKPLSPSKLKKFNRPKQKKRPRKTQKRRSKPTSVKTSDYEDI